jgi:segregation and condensation protein B
MLLEKKLIRVLGRKDIPGRPMIYGTTRQFLEVFNLKDLRDLPSPKEIESLGAEIEADSLFAESAEANAMLIEGTLPMASDKADPQTSNQQAPDHSPTAGTNQALTIHLPEPVPGDAAEETAATVLADPPPTEKPPESAASENAARTSQDPSAAHGTLPVSEDTESASPQDREDGKTS